MSKSLNAKRGYNNSDITIIEVYQLGGALRHIHLEDVALKAAELSPKAFSWKKYPEHINMEAVRMALKNELGARNRRIVGSIRDGWMLTPNGLSWYLANVTTEAKQAQQLEKILNDDFRSLQMKLERIRRVARLRQGETNEDIVPGEGLIQTEYGLGGPEHGNGTKGELAGPGEEERSGSSLLPGDEKGGPSKVSERKYKQTTFRVEYRHAKENSPRSHYDKETRIIFINLDHPQIAGAARDSGGIESKQFREMTYEIAFVQYAIALGHERLEQDPFYSGIDTLYQINETINRVSRAAYA